MEEAAQAAVAAQNHSKNCLGGGSLEGVRGQHHSIGKQNLRVQEGESPKEAHVRALSLKGDRVRVG